jgi:uncharacterized protein YacL
MQFPLSKTSFQDILAYIVAYASSFFLVVVMLKLPYRLLKPKHLIDEFYQSGFAKNVIVECFIVFIYLLVTESIAYYLQFNNFTEKLVISVLVTIAFSALFIAYFTSQSRSMGFFSRFYRATTWHATVYEVLFVFIVYCKYHHMIKFLSE